MNKLAKPPTPVEALQRAVKIAGGQSKLAKIIDPEQKKLTQQYIWNWIHRDKKTSAKWVVKVSEATNVPCHELRPDIFPAPLAVNDSLQDDLA